MANDDIRQAIEIAVQTTGQVAVTQLSGSLQNVTSQIAAMQQQLKSGAIGLDEFIDQTSKLIGVTKQFQSEIEAARSAEGQAMRERIENYARLERQAEALNAQLAKNQQAREKEAAAAQWVTRQTTELNDVLQGMADHERTAATATVSHTASMGAGTSGAKAYNASLMSVAYALDDVRYGLGAAVNNIPMLAMAAGASAQWAAGIAIAGIGIFEAAKALKTFGDAAAVELGVAEDKTKKWVGSLDDAKVKLEAIQSKTYKVQMDDDEIARLERRVETIQERLNAFNAGRRDNLAEEMGKQARDATHTYAGGTEGLAKAVSEIEVTRGVSHANQNDVDRLKQLRGRAATLDELIKAGHASDTDIEQSGDLAQKINKLEHDIRDAEANWVKEEVGAFQTGDPQAIQRMQGRARQFPGAFSHAGPGGVTAAEAIANLPSTPAEALRRIDEEQDQKDRDEKERERSRAFRESRRQKQRAADEADAAFARADDVEIEGGELARKTAKEIKRNKARDAGRERNARFGDTPEEFRRLANFGKPQADAARQRALAAQFQQETGANDETSVAAGRGMDASMAKGFSVQQAFLIEVRKLNGIISRQAADLDGLNEALGQATEEMGQTSAKVMGMGRFQRRGGMQMRSIYPNFGG